MNDLEHLQSVGIDPNTGENATSAPQTAETPSQESPPAKPSEMFEIAGQQYPTSTEFVLKNGKDVLRVPYEKMANVYRQWNHQQNQWTKEYKPKIEEFERLRPEFEKYKGFYDKFGGFQEWSEKNPKEWQTLYGLYQDRDKHLLAARSFGQQQSDQNAQQMGLDPQTLQPVLSPLIEEIAQLKNQLNEFHGFKSKVESAEQLRQEAADVEVVKSEISEFQKKYSDISLEERDPNGVALWAKIIRWGLDNGYSDFEPAARVYLKDRIEESIASRARSEALKGLKSDKQNGIVKRSATPINGQERVSSSNRDVRKMSYGELSELAKSQVLNG